MESLKEKDEEDRLNGKAFDKVPCCDEAIWNK